MATTDTGSSKQIRMAKFKAVFAKNLNELCKSSPLKKEVLAHTFNVSDRQLRRYRQADVPDMPKHYVIPIMAKFFNVPIDELYSATGAGVARNKRELELIKRIREGKPNLPTEMILEAMTMMLGGMSNGDRLNWMENGRRLSNYHKEVEKLQKALDKEQKKKPSG